MKLPGSPPSFASLTTLANWGKSLASSVAAGWQKQHKPDGTHAAITADRVTATGAVLAGSMTSTTDVAATTVTLASRSSTGTRYTGVLSAAVPAVSPFSAVTLTPAVDLSQDTTSLLHQIVGTAVQRPTVTLRVPPSGTVHTTYVLYVDPALSSGTTNYTAYFNTGRVMAVSGYHERSRTTAMGEYEAVAFAAGNFVGVGGGTWTVASGDVSTNRRTRIGRQTHWVCWVSGTDITGTITQLDLTLPDGATAASTMPGYAYVLDNGTYTGANVRVNAGSTVVSINRADGAAFATGTGVLQVRLTITYEV